MKTIWQVIAILFTIYCVVGMSNCVLREVVETHRIVTTKA